MARNNMVYFSRHTHLELSPEGHYEPVFCAEGITDGRYDFRTNTMQRPPTENELGRYPTDFIGYIATWISDVTKRLWRKRFGQEQI